MISPVLLVEHRTALDTLRADLLKRKRSMAASSG
jgi:hypothetical protein